MSFVKLWVHLIWSTKNREKLINEKLQQLLLKHIKDNSIKKDIHIDSINCVTDHIHILLSLSPDQTLSKTVQLIKGESSFWINKNNLLSQKFEWQSEYMAISVSESVVNRVREYIQNQQEHHKRKSFSEEVIILLEKNGYKRNDIAPAFMPEIKNG